jgi:DNA-binding LacI/PurR family transcriptional regulator
MITITDVAKAANVSKKTVSRVINDHPDVAESTRRHVKQVIAELGYQPSMLARGLAQGKANSVGVIIDQSAEEVFSYPLYSDNLRGISRVLSAHNIDMLVHFTRDAVPYTDLYRQRRVDGFILMSMPMNDPQLEALIASGAPSVVTQRIADNGAPVAWVDVDFEGGALEALDHLFTLGHRRIGLVTSPPTKIYAYLLLRGYRTAHERHGLTIPDSFVLHTPAYTSPDPDRITALLAQPDPPTAFACSDDLMAIRLIQLLQQTGYDVPGDISVIGSDDALLAQFFTPPLTTIRQDALHKGSMAAEILLRQLHGEALPGQPEQQLLPTHLTIRGTTGPVRPADERRTASHSERTRHQSRT